MESRNTIAMKTLTQSLRAKDILAKNGISSKLVRTSGESCGYGLYVFGDIRKAKAILAGGAP